jgi:DNA replication protein DnaC
MNRIFLTDDQRTLETLREMRLPAHKLSGEIMPDLRDIEVIVVGKNGDAKKSALGLASRGIAEHRLSYIETASGIALSNLVKNPKHLHWDDARSLLEVEDEDDFEVYESGFGFLDPNLMWRMPELCIVAGPYGSGKSLVAQVLAARFMAFHGDKLNTSALLCSWEDLASEMKRGVSNHAKGLGMYPNELLSRMHYVARPADCLVR